MKKRVFTVFTALLCLLALAGCKTEVEDGFDIEDIAKSQKITVADASGKEKAVLETASEIEAFLDAVNMEGWQFAELPKGMEKAGSFTLWQSETVNPFSGGKEAVLREICTFTIYGQDYLSIEPDVMGMTFTLAVPEAAGTYLRELAA